MRIAIFADFGSTIARDWARTVEHAGHTVGAFSSTWSDIEQDGVTLPATWPTRLRYKYSRAGSASNGTGTRVPKLRFACREAASFVATRAAVDSVSARIVAFEPDIVHCLRLPFETIAMVSHRPARPVVASVWGNDFTLHARSSRVVAHMTRQAVASIDGIHADAPRDLKLARGFGLRTGVPTLAVPGSGGVPLDELLLDITKSDAKRKLGLPVEARLVVNPRGVRSYIEPAAFPSAAEALASERLWFVDVDVGSRLGWAHVDGQLGITSQRTTTRKLDRFELFLLFRAADIVVSPSYHDGLPNSIVEAMGSGAAPILSDLESTNHLTEQLNGAKFDLRTPAGKAGLAQVLAEFDDSADYEVLSKRNQELVASLHSRSAAVASVDQWYRDVAERSRSRTCPDS